MKTDEQIQKSARAPRVMTCAQVEQELRTRVNTGQWALGTMLPGRRDLAKELGVGINTLQRALTPLLDDGTLRADGGRGTFVSEKLTQPLPAPAQPIWGETERPVRSLVLGIVAAVSSDETEIVSRQSNLWQHTIVHAMEREIAGKDGSLRFVNLSQDGKRKPMREAVEQLLSEGITAFAGVFPTTNEPKDTVASIALLDAAGVPSVLISSVEIGYAVPHVFYDNRSAGFQAAQHLIRQGWRDLVYIAPFEASWIETRLNGVREAVENDGQGARLQIFPSTGRANVVEARPSVEGSPLQVIMHGEYKTQGYQAGVALWSQNPDLAMIGVIAINDHTAHGFLRASEEAGRVVGQDFALLGFDDLPDSRVLGMTSLHPPLEAMGREAARVLLQRLQGEPGTMQIRLRSHLIPRASTRPRS